MDKQEQYEVDKKFKQKLMNQGVIEYEDELEFIDSLMLSAYDSQKFFKSDTTPL
jgi:hypothetical protein